MPSRAFRLLSALAALALASCRGAAPAARDFGAHPVAVEAAMPPALYASSDIHGGYDRLIALLAANHVLAGAPAAPEAARWAAGGATLVVAGDLVDKGPAGLEVVAALRALQADAAAAGGRVIVLLGNHEAELFADPENKKADGPDGLDAELRAAGIEPKDFVRSDPRAAWLAGLPFVAKVGPWLFSHAGDTGGRSLAAIAQQIEAGFAAHGWADDAITGSDSILESRDWWADDDGIGARYAAAAGARHLVFGHDPHALGPEGAIATAQDGALFRIDCGMSPDIDYSEGCLFHVTRQGATDVAEELSPSGAATPLWTGPAM